VGVTPIFVFDSDEKWYPVSVDESLDATRPELQTATGAIPWPADIARLNEDCLRLNFPSDMRPVDLPPVGYHRMVRAVGLYWHQFWLWYLYNPWSVAGIGRHEGDWEFVQLGCTDEEGDSPVLVTYSQHHTGSKREFWSVSLQNGRPLVFVARDSHANYLALSVTAAREGRGRPQRAGGVQRLAALSSRWRDTHARIARECLSTVPSASRRAGSLVSPVASRSASREPFRRNGIGWPGAATTFSYRMPAARSAS
jgi:hypothetical protein